MKGLRKYSVFAGSLVMALAIGHLMQRTAPEHHPALAANSWSQTRLSDADWLLRSVPPESVMPLTAEIDPFSFSTRPVLTEPAVGPSPMPPVAPQMPEALAGPVLDILLQDRVEPVTVDPNGQLARLDLESSPFSAPFTELPDPAVAAPAPKPVADCNRAISLSTEPPAMLLVSVEAPCDADARVIVRHDGLAITEMLSPFGQLMVDVPALAEMAEVSVVFADGETVQASTEVADMTQYHRVGIQWQGPDSFQLHAYEFDARFGEAGHVSAAMPRDPGHALRATGGFMNLLGDSRLGWPLLAEVYTFPAGRLPQPGTVRIDIEAMVTPEVCGREMLGQTLEIRGDRVATVADVSVQMPGCDLLGQFIVLQNVLEDIKVAGN